MIIDGRKLRKGIVGSTCVAAVGAMTMPAVNAGLAVRDDHYKLAQTQSAVQTLATENAALKQRLFSLEGENTRLRSIAIDVSGVKADIGDLKGQVSLMTRIIVKRFGE